MISEKSPTSSSVFFAGSAPLSSNAIRLTNKTNISKILKLLTPISLVYEDPENQLLQLFKSKTAFFLVVKNQFEEIIFLPSDKLINPLQQHERGHDFLSRIEQLGLRKWQIVYRSDLQKAYIWPNLSAAGHDGEDSNHESIDRSRTLSGKSHITISNKEMHKAGYHLNKHGRGMGFESKKDYDAAAKEFAVKHQTNPQAKVIEGRLNTGNNTVQYQRVITFEGKFEINLWDCFDG